MNQYPSIINSIRYPCLCLLWDRVTGEIHEVDLPLKDTAFQTKDLLCFSLKKKNSQGPYKICNKFLKNHIGT